MKYKSNSQQETAKLGVRLGQLVQATDVICLTGDLGAGKTTLSKSIGEGMGIKECITSPTFTIIHEYEGRIPLYHFDVYRIGSLEEMDDLGYEEYFYGEGVCLVEWASQIKELIPKKHLWIHISRIGDQEREIEITGYGKHFEEMIEELKKI